MLGLIGKKLGMTQIFDEKGAPQGVTVIEVEPNLVVAQRTLEKDGYSAVVLGWGQIKASRRKKPVAGQFAEGLEPTRLLRELKGFEKECKTGRPHRGGGLRPGCAGWTWSRSPRARASRGW